MGSNSAQHPTHRISRGMSGSLFARYRAHSGDRLTHQIDDLDSDLSSIVSSCDRMGLSELSDSDDEYMSEIDYQKCRIPDLEKALSQLRTESRLGPQDSTLTMTRTNTTHGSAAAGGEPNPAQSYNNASTSPDNTHALTAPKQSSLPALLEDSFVGRLSQLASANISSRTLSRDTAKIPSATAAAHLLQEAAKQIQSWLSITWDAIREAGCEDDLDWALQAGRPSLEIIDELIDSYQNLVSELSIAVDDFNLREDLENAPDQDTDATKTPNKPIDGISNQISQILENWSRLSAVLKAIKEKVELALEWDELWHIVVGDIEAETDALTDLVFEMEERRHAWLAQTSISAQDDGDVSIAVEDFFNNDSSRGNGFGLPPTTSTLPTMAQPQPITGNDSNLIALFARLQPLRASLDFLPFRLTVFLERAKSIFPSACSLLENRAQGVEERWRRLHEDTEALKKELGEDRYLVAFRSAFKQARQLTCSIERGIAKLKESISTEVQKLNSTLFRDRLSDYLSKKEHYVPSIQKVMAIMKDAMKDRSSVSREVKSLQTQLDEMWKRIDTSIQKTDKAIEDVYAEIKRNSELKAQELATNKNSVSDSTDGATTPSSPISPIDGSRTHDKFTEPLTPATTVDAEDYRQKHVAISQTPPIPSVNRPSTITPTGTAYHSRIPRPTPQSRATTSDTSGSGSRKLSVDSNASIPSIAAYLNRSTPMLRKFSSTSSNRRPSLSSSDGGSSTAHKGPKPRWAYSFNTNDLKVGHQFKSLAQTTPSPYHKYAVPRLGTPTAARSSSSLAGGSPSAIPQPLTMANLERGRSESPALVSPPALTGGSALRGAGSMSRRPSYAQMHSYTHATRPGGAGLMSPRSSFGTAEVQRPIMLKKRASAAQLGGGPGYFGGNRSVSQVREREAVLGRPATSMGRPSSSMGRPSITYMGTPLKSSVTSSSRRYSNSNGIDTGRSKRASLIPIPSPPAGNSPPPTFLPTPPSMLTSRRMSSRASSFLGEKPRWR